MSLKPILLSAQDLTFPNPELADKDGLLAIGGDLSTPRLLEAYSNGIFPWYEPDYPILWWSPDPRLILKPQAFKLSRSLKQALKKPFHFTIDTNFSAVIQACATTSGRMNHTWIIPEMITAYTELHHLGYAHSIEVWYDDQLAGGLYGLSLGRIFFGESMFHYVRDASKLAMYHLCSTVLAWNFDFIDCQLPTSHLQSLGAEIISRHSYLQQLKTTLNHPTRKGSWKSE